MCLRIRQTTPTPHTTSPRVHTLKIYSNTTSSVYRKESTAESLSLSLFLSPLFPPLLNIRISLSLFLSLSTPAVYVNGAATPVTTYAYAVSPTWWGRGGISSRRARSPSPHLCLYFQCTCGGNERGTREVSTGGRREES